MKYVRVVLAVEEEDLEQLRLPLEEFIEETDPIRGAHVSAPYNDRESATGPDWHNGVEWYSGREE